MAQSPSYEFDISISFARPDRPIAKEIAEKLTNAGLVVFYDESYQPRLVGKRLDKEFKWIFGKGTRFFVPLISHHYVDRAWPQFEWSIARVEAERRKQEFIVPIRLDDTLVFGLHDSVGYIDLRQVGTDELVAILCGKCGIEPSLMARSLKSQTWVVTFGLLIDDVIRSQLLPDDAPKRYYALCDWLERDIWRHLYDAPIVNPRVCEASARDGEALSIRIAFEWNPEEAPLCFPDLVWWNVLEVVPYESIYFEESR
jgi:hypothetical protein